MSAPAGQPRMPDPGREMTPKELAEAIAEWAVTNGFTCSAREASGEHAVLVVQDPADGQTSTTIPNAKRGRRLRPDQVRYTMRMLNNGWRG